MNTPAVFRSVRHLLPSAAALIVSLAAPAVSHAVITADFSSPADWPGTAGNGWANAWQGVNIDPSTGVTNTNPLHGGGSYLQVVDDATINPAFIYRQMDGSGGVNLSEPYRLTLSFRFDAPNLDNFNQFNDRIALYGAPSVQSGSNSSNTWLIGVAGGNEGTESGQSVFNGTWYFYDRRTSDAFNTSNMVDTNLALVAGRIYGITIEVFPQTGKYNAMIDDGVNPAFSASNLTFRRGDTALGNWIHANMNTSSASDSAAFSIDNIRVEQIPEPSAAVALLFGVGMIALRRGQRTRRS